MNISSSAKNMQESKRSASSSATPKRYTVFIGCLPKNITHEQVYRYFSKFGKISNIKISGKAKAGHGTLDVGSEQAFNQMLRTKHKLFGRDVICRPFLKGEQKRQFVQKLNKKRVFLKGIPKHFSDKKIEGVFSRFGDVERAYAVRSFQGESYGYGCVNFLDERTAQRLVQRGFLEVLDGRVRIACLRFEGGMKKASDQKAKQRRFQYQSESSSSSWAKEFEQNDFSGKVEKVTRRGSGEDFRVQKTPKMNSSGGRDPLGAQKDHLKKGSRLFEVFEVEQDLEDSGKDGNSSKKSKTTLGKGYLKPFQLEGIQCEKEECTSCFDRLNEQVAEFEADDLELESESQRGIFVFDKFAGIQCEKEDCTSCFDRMNEHGMDFDFEEKDPVPQPKPVRGIFTFDKFAGIECEKEDCTSCFDRMNENIDEDFLVEEYQGFDLDSLKGYQKGGKDNRSHSRQHESNGRNKNNPRFLDAETKNSYYRGQDYDARSLSLSKRYRAQHLIDDQNHTSKRSSRLIVNPRHRAQESPEPLERLRFRGGRAYSTMREKSLNLMKERRRRSRFNGDYLSQQDYDEYYDKEDDHHEVYGNNSGYYEDSFYDCNQESCCQPNYTVDYEKGYPQVRCFSQSEFGPTSSRFSDGGERLSMRSNQERPQRRSWITRNLVPKQREARQENHDEDRLSKKDYQRGISWRSGIKPDRSIPGNNYYYEEKVNPRGEDHLHYPENSQGGSRLAAESISRDRNKLTNRSRKANLSLNEIPRYDNYKDQKNEHAPRTMLGPARVTNQEKESRENVNNLGQKCLPEKCVACRCSFTRWMIQSCGGLYPETADSDSHFIQKGLRKKVLEMSSSAVIRENHRESNLMMMPLPPPVFQE